ncbi:MAG TPA: response regulator [Planctomycetota bacterium]|nr:response regulator [Planctomycetota bacterium]
MDDDHDVANILMEILRSQGYDVSAIHDPLKVARRVADVRPDLLILDFDMPKLLGPELAARLKANPETSGLPVIFLSGMTDDDHKAIAASSGGAAYLEKPVDRDKLLDTIRSILPPPPT